MSTWDHYGSQVILRMLRMMEVQGYDHSTLEELRGVLISRGVDPRTGLNQGQSPLKIVQDTIPLEEGAEGIRMTFVEFTGERKQPLTLDLVANLEDIAAAARARYEAQRHDPIKMALAKGA